MIEKPRLGVGLAQEAKMPNKVGGAWTGKECGTGWEGTGDGFKTYTLTLSVISSGFDGTRRLKGWQASSLLPGGRARKRGGG
jgi:hypothetical protein